MRCTPFLLLTLLAAAAGGGVAAAPVAGAAAQDLDRPPLHAALAACGTGPTADERFAVFTASMPARRGTRRMAMRFDVYERTRPDARWQRVRAEALARWERSKPDRAGFVFTKRVERLRENVDYRAVVRFRWYDADGVVQRRARRRTGVCEQPDPRPDLVVESIGVAGALPDGRTRYLVTVANAGLTAADAFDVGLVAAGEPADPRPVAGLAPGARTTVEVAGLRCRAGEAVAATVDVTGAVDEADERNNASRRPCDAS